MARLHTFCKVGKIVHKASVVAQEEAAALKRNGVGRVIECVKRNENGREHGPRRENLVYERESRVHCAKRDELPCVCVVSTSASLGITQLLYKLTNMEFNPIAQAIRKIQRGETEIRYVSGFFSVV